MCITTCGLGELRLNTGLGKYYCSNRASSAPVMGRISNEDTATTLKMLIVIQLAKDSGYEETITVGSKEKRQPKSPRQDLLEAKETRANPVSFFLSSRSLACPFPEAPACILLCVSTKELSILEGTTRPGAARLLNPTFRNKGENQNRSLLLINSIPLKPKSSWDFLPDCFSPRILFCFYFFE